MVASGVVSLAVHSVRARYGHLPELTVVWLWDQTGNCASSGCVGLVRSRCGHLGHRNVIVTCPGDARRMEALSILALGAWALRALHGVWNSPTGFGCKYGRMTYIALRLDCGVFVGWRVGDGVCPWEEEGSGGTWERAELWADAVFCLLRRRCCLLLSFSFLFSVHS